VLVLPAELTSRQATACLAMLLHGLRQESQAQIVADASALSHFDSAALAVLLACRRESQAQGKGFVIQAMPAKLRALAGVYGVSDLLPELS
jgi:phospholipid transport system transporter-binding protein